MLSFPQMKIDITIDTKYKKLVKIHWLRQIARQVLIIENASSKAEMGLVITGTTTIHQLNRDYLDEDHLTDVLSFPMIDLSHGADNFVGAPDNTLQLGEIFICYPQSVRQATEHHHSTEKEIALLVIHGILHLLGYDHDIPDLEFVMRKHEANILKTIEAKYL